MSDLTAIDILVNPDDATIEKAGAVNARLRQSVPSGYALDATHQPHITTLQRYVHTADRVFETVERTIAGVDINQTTLKWVEQYVPDQIGSSYIPHISLGFATVDDLKVIEAEPFTAFAVHPASVAVYHLGNNGNARTELKSWKV
jgi:hypothetical protein